MLQLTLVDVAFSADGDAGADSDQQIAEKTCQEALSADTMKIGEHR